MTRPVVPRAAVRVPATTANLGCGFDIFGLALQLYNTFTLTVTDEPGWRVSIPAGIAMPTDANNLFYQAARRLFTHIGNVPEALHLTLEADIPLARGLGSSSTAIVGGLVAANTLMGDVVDRDTLLAMAIEIEGHPDNVTPALMGGLTLSYTRDGHQTYLALPVGEALRFVVAIPDFELSTASARAVLPEKVPRADAVFNSSRTALFVYALHHERYDLLATAMEDRLHQPYRAALVPGMEEAIAAGRQAQALGVALSGAGPTLVAVTLADNNGVATALQEAFARHGISCATRVLCADTVGAVSV
jgi:homoserine kinase